MPQTFYCISPHQYSAPSHFPIAYEGLSPSPSHREAVVNAFVYVHLSLHQANTRITRRGGRTTAVTPRHYLDFINHYVSALLHSCQLLKIHFFLNAFIFNVTDTL